MALVMLQRNFYKYITLLYAIKQALLYMNIISLGFVLGISTTNANSKYVKWSLLWYIETTTVV